MATIVITIDIPEDGDSSFAKDTQLIDYRDNLGDTVCRVIEAIGYDHGVTAEVEHAS